MTPAEASVILRRKAAYLATRNDTNRSWSALRHDQEEIEALDVALQVLESQGSPLDPCEALRQLLDEIDSLNLGYGIEYQPLWKLVAYGRVVLDQVPGR